MKLTELRISLLLPTDLQFNPIRVGAGKPITVKQGTRVKYTIERTGDYNDAVVLRLILPRLVMGYKTYTWARTYDSIEAMRDDGFTV